MAALSPEETRRRVDASLKRRYRTERLFRSYGLLSVLLGVAFLVVLFTTIIGNGYSAFRQTYVRLDIRFDPATIDPDGKRDSAALASADYELLVKDSLRSLFPDVTSTSRRFVDQIRQPGKIGSPAGNHL